MTSRLGHRILKRSGKTLTRYGDNYALPVSREPHYYSLEMTPSACNSKNAFFRPEI